MEEVRTSQGDVDSSQGSRNVFVIVRAYLTQQCFSPDFRVTAYLTQQCFSHFPNKLVTTAYLTQQCFGHSTQGIVLRGRDLDGMATLVYQDT